MPALQSTNGTFAQSHYRVMPFAAIIIFAFASLVVIIGGRLSDGSTLDGFLRSVHVLDILSPLMLLFLFGRFAEMNDIFGSKVVWAGIYWCVFAFISAVIGHHVVSTNPPNELIFVSLLFAIKEFEFVILLFFSGLFAFHRPRSAELIIFLCCVILGLWTLKEYFAPTGFYYMGLPFESGPSQTGAVYAITAFLWWFYLAHKWHRLGNVMRYLVGPAILALLVFGNLGSLSRTSQAAMLAGMGVLFLSKGRSWPILLLSVPLAYFVYSIGFSGNAALLDAAFVNRWAGAADNFPDRVLKWSLMLDFQSANPWSFLTGCGFASPNRYVLYQFSPTVDLGYVLAVDNGYIRRIFEVGIIGTALYFIFLARLFWRQWRTSYGSIAAGTVVALLTIAVAIESFQVTQIAASYFLFAGCLIGLSKASSIQQSD